MSEDNPVVLTFLAPAPQCNQHCPLCIIDQAEEPVRDFTLQPVDYAHFLRRFLDEGIPVRAVTFQGFEVTLPASWPYLEAVFETAGAHDVRRSFITNGMLLHKWTPRILALGAHRITVSLDGSTAAVNDAIRGLDGALQASVWSVQRFLAEAPRLRPNLAVASTLFGDENFTSLLDMPRLLSDLGISRWMVSAAAMIVNGKHRIIGHRAQILRRFEQLKQAAAAKQLVFHVSDELGQFRDSPRSLPVKHVADPLGFFRLDPSGGVRAGPDILNRWEAERVSRWDPRTIDPLDAARSALREHERGLAVQR